MRKANFDLGTMSLLIFEIATYPVNINVTVLFFLKVFSKFITFLRSSIFFVSAVISVYFRVFFN
jgi:hypothetical protein